MSTYSVEMNDLPIPFPRHISADDLANIMNFVDKLRIEYPNDSFTIYEHSKTVIDY
jgi:hypothetical protein